MSESLKNRFSEIIKVYYYQNIEIPTLKYILDNNDDLNINNELYINKVYKPIYNNIVIDYEKQQKTLNDIYNTYKHILSKQEIKELYKNIYTLYIQDKDTENEYNELENLLSEYIENNPYFKHYELITEILDFINIDIFKYSGYNYIHQLKENLNDTYIEFTKEDL
jgi:hypothetical protein